MRVTPLSARSMSAPPSGCQPSCLFVCVCVCMSVQQEEMCTQSGCRGHQTDTQPGKRDVATAEDVWSPGWAQPDVLRLCASSSSLLYRCSKSVLLQQTALALFRLGLLAPTGQSLLSLSFTFCTFMVLAAQTMSFNYIRAIALDVFYMLKLVKKKHAALLVSYNNYSSFFQLFPWSTLSLYAPNHPPTSDHLALTSALIVNEISLSLWKFLQLILLRLYPLLIVSPLNNLLNNPFSLRDSRILAHLSHLFPVYPLHTHTHTHPTTSVIIFKFATVCNHMQKRLRRRKRSEARPTFA